MAKYPDSTTSSLECRLRARARERWPALDDIHNDYEDSFLPTGSPVGTCEQALDTACGLYLDDPTAWTQPLGRTYGRDH